MKHIRNVIRLTIMFLLTACASDDTPIENIDFSEGNYAVYIRHKEHGTFMVTNKKALQKNRKKLEVSLSILNILPGEGDRSYGVMVFKDNVRIKTKLGGVFNTFKIGNLNQYAIPVKEHQLHGVKQYLSKRLDSIRTYNTNYIYHNPQFLPDNRTFGFRIYFPSIAVSIQHKRDSIGNNHTFYNGISEEKWQKEARHTFEKQWSTQLEACIRKKAGETANFAVSIAPNTAYGVLTNLSNGGSEYLRYPNKNAIPFEAFQFYNFVAYIQASEAVARQLMTNDYADCLNAKDRKISEIKATLKELVALSAHPNLDVDKGDIGITDYSDAIEKSNSLYEQEYQLSWFNIKE